METLRYAHRQLRPRIVFFFAIFMICSVFAGSGPALGASTSALLNRGNRAFQEGNFEKAFQYYTQAGEADPLSPLPVYSQGNVLYMQGNYHAALEAFQKVSPDDGELAVLATYNQGNSLARIGELEEKANPSDALEYYWKSIGAYRRTLSLDPGFWDASYNIEVVKYRIKSLLDLMTQSGTQEGSGASPQREMRGSAGEEVPPAQGDTNGSVPGQPSFDEPEPRDETAQEILNEESQRRAEQNPDQGVRSNAIKDW
jgi:tetratricopeptide (TPR) repeat protein